MLLEDDLNSLFNAFKSCSSIASVQCLPSPVKSFLSSSLSFSFVLVLFLVLNDYDLKALSAETVQRYRTIFAGNKPSSPWNSDSTEDFLYHIGAIAKGVDGSFHPTRAGLLAFGYEYEITRYLHTTSWTIAKRPAKSIVG